ncbi:putative oxidoreductase, Zn-dependent and NAD(P)-binding [Beijerinckiaceae bacterium RH AL1]|nr:oxidoreductase [Beijerinckiaceae bacterium]VVB43278.1 putative oxidoreductase, Zn-dependent and NAD(P)-binding [Beijerinckiaceae bacterium RH AL8]VVB43293.1 putative oxidoreductase, Zn-dependent and NAD(P)-binding [Beijerinckiaceae bacterium RH CH11]VVC53760.1 putative oxidoreductase, Zn-dependent and NAD(P)-binding [Beijerinckiaceae bacterium RH AL1]
MKALRIDKTEDGTKAAIVDFDEAQLMPGNVTVRVSHSTVNYKDGLAITGKNPVVRVSPMIGGIDFAGTVETSEDPNFKPGDRVVCNGWGLSETHFGGYAEKARVKGEWLVKLPESISAADAMAIGTAGYTAMLSVLALEAHGLQPKDGPAIVTGAAGGVGSFAIMLLAKAGWHVIASTGRASEADYLKGLGAAEIIDRAELSEKGKPLGKERWAAGVDSVGSMTLANLLAQTKRGGAIAACGLAGGMDLPSSVAPFILRGVALLGIDSVYCPHERREQAWARLATDLDKDKVAQATRTIGFDEVIETAHAIIDGKVRGRVIVTIP